MPKTANNTNRPLVLEVRLGETLVGTLTNLPNDQNLFVFDSAYVSDENRPVLSLSFYDAYRASCKIPLKRYWLWSNCCLRLFWKP